MEDNNLWNAFPPTLSTNVRNIEYITIDREKRLSGRSKMNFFGLLIHAFKVFSVLRFRILISTSVYSTFAYIFLFDKNFTTFFLITILFSFFNIINFTLSFFQRGKFEESFKKLKFYKFINIYLYLSNTTFRYTFFLKQLEPIKISKLIKLNSLGYVSTTNIFLFLYALLNFLLSHYNIQNTILNRCWKCVISG